MKKQAWWTKTIIATIAGILALPNLAYSHQIIEVNGTVTVKKAEGNDFQTMGIGSQLETTDQIKTGAGSSITLLCNDLSLWTLSSNQTSRVGCNEFNLTRNPLEYYPGSDDASIPYLITPRNTLLSGSDFTISWNQVNGARSYLVTIEGDNGFSWSKEVTDTTTVYDGEELSPDAYYLVTVKADSGISSLDYDGEKLGFSLLAQESADQINSILTNINNSGLSAEGKALATAISYARANLISEAIATLETLVSAGSKTPAVYQMLGDLYVTTGLNTLAEASYNQAIALGNFDQDLEVLSHAQAGLAGINMILGNHYQAGKLAQQAEMGYHQLGYHHEAMTLDENLMFLMGENNNTMTLSRATRGGGVDIFSTLIVPQNCVPGRNC